MTYELHTGDCIEIMRTFNDREFDFAFCDPPYNVGKDYGIYKDDLPEDEYFIWCEEWLSELKRIACQVAIYPPKKHLRWFWNQLPENYQIIAAWSPEGAIRSNYIHQYIPLLVPPKPVRRIHDHWFNPQIPGLGYFYREEKFDHPGQTSLDITNRIIEAFTLPESTVIDPFSGTGTTGVSCVSRDRYFCGIELNPKYTAIAEKRLQQAEQQMRIKL